MNKTFNIIGKTLLTILIMLLIGYGWAFFELKIMLKPNPELFGYVFFVQEDEKMSPTFDIDDVVVVKKDETYGVGDRIFYMLESGEFKVRTLTNASLANLEVKCDNCSEATSEVGKSTVIGKAIGKIKGFNKFIKFFKQKWFLTAIAILGFAFVIISQYIHETPKKVVK